MDMEIDFNYCGSSTIIQCNSQDKMEDIFKRLSTKTEVNLKSTLFLYGGTPLKGDSTIETIMNTQDKNRKKMNILVNEQEIETEESKNPIYIKPMNFVCPTCGENARVNLTEYKIFSQCKKGHSKGNILLHENKEQQKIDISKIICGDCKEVNKGSSFENSFFRCNKCKINLCPLCKNKHDKTHNIINYDDKDFLCEIHNEKLSSYCDTCEKNICLYCSEHNEHKIINFKEIIPDLNNETMKIMKLELKINDMKSKIDEIINLLKLVKENFEYYYEINKNSWTFLNTKKLNYEILNNFNRIKSEEIENDIDIIIKSKDINESFLNVKKIYGKMLTKFQDTLTINYTIGKNSMIKLFGSEFFKNNKNLCSMIINDKECNLQSKFYLKDIDMEKEILQVILKGITNLTNISCMFSGCSSLYNLPDIDKWKTINIVNMNNLFYRCPIDRKNIEGIKVWDILNVKYIDNMFAECTELTSLPNISKWNTSNVVSMNNIFGNCKKLWCLPEISNWNTTNVRDMSSMFFECSSLKFLPEFSNWNTNNVKRMSKIFSGCKSLEYLPDISNWNTSKNSIIEDISGMFSGCSGLSRIPDISNWNTAKVENMSSIFQNCSSLKSLPNISKWNTNAVKTMNNMFDGCTGLKSLPDISAWNTINVKNISYMFCKCSSLVKLPDLSKYKFNAMNDMRCLFSGCCSLESLPDISNWINAENGKNLCYINGLFSGCYWLKSLPDISKWNTSNVNYMHMLFENCSLLKILPDISKWDVSNVKNMNYLFSDCSALVELPDISKWNLANLREMNYMFNNCSSLKYLPPISFWNVSNVKKAIGLFKGCSLLEELPDLSNWQTDNIESMKEMFSGCSSLISMPNIANWDTKNVQNMSCMFENCSNLKDLRNLSKWNINKVKEAVDMFKGCHKKLKTPKLKVKK